LLLSLKKPTNEEKREREEIGYIGGSSKRSGYEAILDSFSGCKNQVGIPSSNIDMIYPVPYPP
jgi:hypothetical protein